MKNHLTSSSKALVANLGRGAEPRLVRLTLWSPESPCGRFCMPFSIAPNSALTCFDAKVCQEIVLARSSDVPEPELRLIPSMQVRA